jgi:hypothetical protein
MYKYVWKRVWLNEVGAVGRGRSPDLTDTSPSCLQKHLFFSTHGTRILRSTITRLQDIFIFLLEFWKQSWVAPIHLCWSVGCWCWKYLNKFCISLDCYKILFPAMLRRRCDVATILVGKSWLGTQDLSRQNQWYNIHLPFLSIFRWILGILLSDPVQGVDDVIGPTAQDQWHHWHLYRSFSNDV